MSKAESNVKCLQEGTFPQTRAFGVHVCLSILEIQKRCLDNARKDIFFDKVVINFYVFNKRRNLAFPLINHIHIDEDRAKYK